MDTRLYQIGAYEKAFPDGTTVNTMLRLARDSGYDFLELSIDRTEQRIARLYDPAFQVEALRAVDSAGIAVGSVCVSALGTYTLGHPDPTIEARAVDIFKRAVLFAERLGVRIVQIPACDVPKNGPHSPETDARFIGNLCRLIPFAAAHSVMIGLENMEDDYMDSVRKSLRAVQTVGSPYFQRYSDAGNAYSAALLYGYEVGEDLRAGAGHYAAFHLKETRPGKYGGLFYGEGHVPFAPIVREMWALGVRRYVMEYWYTGNVDWQGDLSRAQALCRAWLEEAGKGKTDAAL